MMISKMALPRRTFLRGMGATLALPLLDAMIPAASALAQTAAASTRRLGFVYIPHGAPAAAWTPPGDSGPITAFSPSLKPLEPFRDHTVVLTNLELALAQGTANHSLANSTFLSAARAKETDGTDYELATTADQLAAKHIGRNTQLPSLELGVDSNFLLGTCDNGYNCVYMNTMAWSSPTTPLPTEANPRVVFERLFGEGGTAAERMKVMRRNRSILDWVSDDMARLQRKLGPGDRTRVDGYLESIREVERRIQRAEAQSEEGLPIDLERPVGAPASWEEHVKLMYDMQVLALQADITRVITFQLAREVSTRTHPQIGVPDPWHPLSHHQEDPEKLAKLAAINTYHISLFAYFLEKMKATPDGDGSLLDHTMYLYGSGMANSDLHDHRNVPMVVVGGRSESGGRHVKYAELTPMANLLLTLLDKVGAHQERFGDSSGRVEGLLSF
jgi:hypothetical protein